MILGLFRKKNVEQSLINKLQLLIGFFPINFFYNFLFYTDTFSVFSLILFFYLNLYSSKNIFLRLLSGILCVLIRQNNIIWINLIPLNEVISFIQAFFNSNCNIKNLLKNAFTIIANNIHILIIDILFIIFIIYNNYSIVLGDKSHHNMVFHLAQMNHLLIFSLLFFPSIQLKTLRNLNKLLKSGKKTVRFILIFIVILSFVLICNRFSYIHDFILSDNRHYIFYYFKKIYLKENIRYALLIYVSLVYSIIINDNLQLYKDNKIISWLICTMLSLIPAKLVEIRYFIPCYIIFIILINYNKDSFEDLHQYIFHWLNIFAHIIINGITIYVFLFKPFENKFMGNELSRFMY
jgi:alpha-1,2-glucosyltransferase